MSASDEGVPYDKNLRLARVCAICGCGLKRLGEDHGDDHWGQNQMDNAMALEIRGYYGTTVFDGTDITGCCLMGFICDPCGAKAMERMTVVQKYTDRRATPEEISELLKDWPVVPGE